MSRSTKRTLLNPIQQPQPKRTLLNPIQQPQPIDTIVDNEITNTDVVNSYKYFNELKENDPNNSQIITDYRNEHEEDDNYNEEESIDSYPKINYSVVNWLFSTMSNTTNTLSKDLYIPHILKFKFIKSEDILKDFLKQQINNAYIMNSILKLFPTIKNAPIIVYRGIKDGFLNIINNNISRGQITFSCFLSTSLFINTAKRFTSDSKHIMSIEIQKGDYLAYVSDKLEHINKHSNVTGEAEVLIPMNATLLQISEPQLDGEYTIHKFRLITYLKETRNSQPLAIAFVDKFSPEIFKKIKALQKEVDTKSTEDDSLDFQASLLKPDTIGGNKLFKINHKRSNKKRSNKKRSNKKRSNKKGSNKKR